MISTIDIATAVEKIVHKKKLEVTKISNNLTAGVSRSNIIYHSFVCVFEIDTNLGSWWQFQLLHDVISRDHKLLHRKLSFIMVELMDERSQYFRLIDFTTLEWIVLTQAVSYTDICQMITYRDAYFRQQSPGFLDPIFGIAHEYFSGIHMMSDIPTNLTDFMLTTTQLGHVSGSHLCTTNGMIES